MAIYYLCQFEHNLDKTIIVAKEKNEMGRMSGGGEDKGIKYKIYIFYRYVAMSHKNLFHQGNKQ